MDGYPVGGLEHFWFFHISGMSSSQLTKSCCSEGIRLKHQPVMDGQWPVGLSSNGSDEEVTSYVVYVARAAPVTWHEWYLPSSHLQIGLWMAVDGVQNIGKAIGKWWFSMGFNGDLPSGKQPLTMENHVCLWVNRLEMVIFHDFLFVYQRVPFGKLTCNQTIETDNGSWINQQTKGSFSITFCMFTRGYPLVYCYSAIEHGLAVCWFTFITKGDFPWLY